MNRRELFCRGAAVALVVAVSGLPTANVIRLAHDDLADVIYDIHPIDTPFYSLIRLRELRNVPYTTNGRMRGGSRFAEWQTETLASR